MVGSGSVWYGELRFVGCGTAGLLGFGALGFVRLVTVRWVRSWQARRGTAWLGLVRTESAGYGKSRLVPVVFGWLRHGRYGAVRFGKVS